MLFKELTQEEKIFCYKCILRIHKECGTINTFLKFNNRKKNFFFQKIPAGETIERLLVNFVWTIVKQSQTKYLNEIHRAIIASLRLLEIIDLFYNSKYPIFKDICKDVAYSEFSYINSSLVKTLEGYYDKKIIDEIADSYKKYISLLPNNGFDNIKIKCNV